MTTVLHSNTEQYNQAARSDLGYRFELLFGLFCAPSSVTQETQMGSMFEDKGCTMTHENQIKSLLLEANKFDVLPP